MKRYASVELVDGSELGVFYTYTPAEPQTWEHPGSPPIWEIEELIHSKKVYPHSLVMDVDKPSIHITNLGHLIDAIVEDKLFQELYAKIEEAIDKAEADPTPELLEETPRREV